MTLANPYEGMSLASRAAWFEPAGIDPEDRAAFDAAVLPVLLDPASFMAMPPTDRLRANVDYVTVHPEKHNQSIWTATTPPAGATPESLVGEIVQTKESGCSDSTCSCTPESYTVLNLPRPDATLSCGTAACLAGWGALFAGAKPVTLARFWDDETLSEVTGPAALAARLRETLSGPSGPDTTLEASTVVTPEGTVRGVAGYAEELFGLAYYDARAMFAGGNSLADLRLMCAQIERGEPADPFAEPYAYSAE